MAGTRAASSSGEMRRSRSGSTSGAESSTPVASRPLRGTSVCMALIALAMILGGGGTNNPQNEMILQVLSALLMIPLVVSRPWQSGLGAVNRWALVLGGLVLVMPVLQLIPLPPSIWQALPGRAVEVQSLAAAQADQRWMPMTMAPARTFASLLAMIWAVLILLQVSRLSLRGRNWICAAIVAVAMLSLLLGALQLSHTGGLTWSLYTDFSEGFFIGFQANRNAEADILLISTLAFGVLLTSRLAARKPSRLNWTALAMGVAAFLVAVFMTGSRTGIALAFPMLVALLAMIWPFLRLKRTFVLAVGASFVVSLASGALLLQLPAVRKVISRFTLTGEMRWEIWADTSFAIKQVWPYGSGIGTIMPMLEAAERLEMVSQKYPVRAHNDWLEWTMEGGIPGLVVLGVVGLVLFVMIVRAIASARADGSDPVRMAQIIFAIGLTVIVALHSVVDYPLRSMSIAALAAVAAAFLTKPAALQHKRP
jgi:O-antigen ligase